MYVITCSPRGAVLLYFTAWVAITVKQFAETSSSNLGDRQSRLFQPERVSTPASSSTALPPPLGSKAAVSTSGNPRTPSLAAVQPTTAVPPTAPRIPVTTNNVLDLVRSRHFIEQGIRLKWIGERMERWVWVWGGVGWRFGGRWVTGWGDGVSRRRNGK